MPRPQGMFVRHLPGSSGIFHQATFTKPEQHADFTFTSDIQRGVYQVGSTAVCTCAAPSK
ncbi:hypothetical protein RvY_02718 [Ramazzottius varieornatus]|uniref:Uncharacterized protein n=1 Tax=Ramazzottius varieornatus TaxID=947166 RepID=A0A1D1UP40_RAMVA|nr:hypothetical protein RvY_02718 [Ramazzottius varieornatus]